MRFRRVRASQGTLTHAWAARHSPPLPGNKPVQPAGVQGGGPPWPGSPSWKGLFTVQAEQGRYAVSVKGLGPLGMLSGCTHSQLT